MSDLSPETFRDQGHAVIERLYRYLSSLRDRPVLARTKPGEVLSALPERAPEEPEPWQAIERDLETLVEPNLTNWQSPGYLAYFATSASTPGILGDALAAGYNQIGILWRTSPVSTELEQAMVKWLTNLTGLPAGFDGQLADTASTASLIALAAAREERFPDVRKTGLSGKKPGVVYCSELAHSSIDKAAVVLGFGVEGLRKIPADDAFRMRVSLLERAIAQDRAEGKEPVAVVATAGTTAVTSIDPLPEIADVCEREGIWMHVDAAYAGCAALLPEVRPLLKGWERADSIVFNPHKWLFVPLECTALLFRRMERVRRAFSIVPHYLETPEGAAGVREYMDYGIQLGRRFRALKLWMTLRSFGASGMRERLALHLEMAAQLRRRLEGVPGIQILAPTLFSVVVFRHAPEGLSSEETDAVNRRILERINSDGRFFISHAVLRGQYVLRAAIGNIRTTPEDVAAFGDSLREAIEAESPNRPPGESRN
ncbi:MAG: amino acid decarboxylase [Acidobacteria bacterium]|nr:amino acid decarboxylase [Acidobacteriota bacterium]